MLLHGRVAGCHIESQGVVCGLVVGFVIELSLRMIVVAETRSHDHLSLEDVSRICDPSQNMFQHQSNADLFESAGLRSQQDEASPVDTTFSAQLEHCVLC